MLNQDLIHLLNQRVRLINKKLNESLQEYGLYNAQWSILYYLNNHGAKTQKEIMNYFHVNAPTITRTVKRMEENGWVIRITGADRRERYIELTDMAKKRYLEIEAIVSTHDEEVLSNINEEEKKLLYHLLNKLD
ncbi:MarR family winged helix-turn-helix transcriptional regulator [Ornithinibacillus halotolerans]|uniref:HTH-type transcriptional regulator YwoH n=1 Tax=Ornithinibacillus halotolerans TaxID=1274357 RepID=A0A916S2S6_9BACI|nr:MarR family transcriptional regulator [Ornithinibacillus halotolerans]GGA81281.1 putative HTH-type transcriptional regulator YwoH [Ornithinibacillus halotolerans]